MTKVIAAQAGWYRVMWSGRAGNPDITQDPIIAWRVCPGWIEPVMAFGIIKNGYGFIAGPDGVCYANNKSYSSQSRLIDEEARADLEHLAAKVPKDELRIALARLHVAKLSELGSALIDYATDLLRAL